MAIGPRSRWKDSLFVSLCLGAAAPILIYRILGWDGGSQATWITVSLFVFGVLSALACWLSTRNVFAIAAMFYLGILIGMLIDATIDFNFFLRDRNLIPFEIVLMWIVAVVPVAAGSFLGRRFQARTDDSNGLNA